MDCSNAPLSHRPTFSSLNNTSEPLKPARVMTKSDIINIEDDEADLPHDNDVADHPWDEWESTFKRAADLLLEGMEVGLVFNEFNYIKGNYLKPKNAFTIM